MKWIIYLLIFCFAYAIGYETANQRATVTVEFIT
jgi:hypothetical protein